MTSLLSHILTCVVLFLFIDAVNADSTVVVWVQDSVNASPYLGWFSTRFVGLTLNSAGVATVVFQAGDLADDSWVVSYPDIRTQTGSFFENSFTCTFRSAGTWWFYLASAGTNLNFDFLQVRVVDNSWTGPITPKFDRPPDTWRYGYPPYGVRFTSDDADATGSDGTVATLPSPTLTSIPARRSSTSTSTSVWLAPLLVGIIMIAITVPIVMCAYKKGKQHSKPAQVQEESAAIENQQQQQQQQQRDQENRVQIAVV